MNIEKNHMASVIDHTFLKTEKENVSYTEQALAVKQLCKEATIHMAFSVCVRPSMVKMAKEELNAYKSNVKICSVIGFPNGDEYSTQEKIEEMSFARSNGAVEFDMVIRVQDLKSGFEKKVYDEILNISNAAKNDVLKVIFENAYLEKAEKLKAYEICKKAFLDSKFSKKRFFKTSTGFAKSNGPIGATLDDVKLMHEISQGAFGIKPAGGINDFETAVNFWKSIGSPMLADGSPDPYKFRIGSSSLLMILFQGKKDVGDY